jgi:hypothetical protein
MNESRIDIAESVKQAKTMMATLHGRASETGSIDDRAELSVLGTTVSRIEELMQIASEYEEILMQQLARTATRIKVTSS